jgi:hypothetical protein
MECFTGKLSMTGACHFPTFAWRAREHSTGAVVGYLHTIATVKSRVLEEYSEY